MSKTADPVNDQPSCAICLKPVGVGILRVVLWAAELGAGMPEDTADAEDALDSEEAALAVVHRECFVAVMHPNYVL
jgi:hypothetical protein